MELNWKMVLPEGNDYERLTNILDPGFSHEKSYRDFFFDFANSTLERVHAVLRLRVLCKYLRGSPRGETCAGDSGEPWCASLVLKENNKVECGEQMLFVLEENSLPWSIVDEVLFHSTSLLDALRGYSAKASEGPVPLSTCQRIASRLEEIALASNEPHPLELRQVGSYATKRRVYTYLQDSLPGSANPQMPLRDVDMKENSHSLKMHICVDKTLFPFGEKYELEVHNVSVPLNDILVELKAFLQQNGIKYSLGSESKFARFMKYVHGLHAPSEYVQEVKLRLASINGYKEVLNWLDRPQEAAIPSLPVHNNMNNNNNTVPISQVSQSTEVHGHSRATNDLEIGLVYHTAYEQLQSQAQNEACDCSQRVTHPAELEYGGRRSVGRHEGSGCEERYQEDYYFDTLHSMLLERHCFVRLRCLNHAETFIFSMKEKSKVEHGEQECVTRRVEVSGDVARLLMQNPTQFLLDQREHNVVAKDLWEYFGVRSLRVVAFFRTERRVYTRRLSAAIPPPWSQASPHPTAEAEPVMPAWGTPARGTLSPEPSSALGAPHPGGTVCVNVDRTVYDLSMPAEAFAAIAAASPSCAYSRAEGQVPPRHVTELYEIELTNLSNLSTQEGLRWVTGELDALGIEWRSGIQRKVEQYFYLADTLLVHSAGELSQKNSAVDLHPTSGRSQSRRSADFRVQ